MRTSHAHCLLCLNDNHESSDWFDMYVCIHLWSKHLNPLKTPATALFVCAVWCLSSGCFWASVLLWSQLQTGQPEHPLSSLVLSYASGFLVYLGTQLSPMTGSNTSHTDCRSFTLCQGKARREGGRQASRTVPHQPWWGDCRPFTRLPGRFFTTWSLRLKNLLLSTATCVIPLANGCWAFTVIWPVNIRQLDWSVTQSF